MKDHEKKIKFKKLFLFKQNLLIIYKIYQHDNNKYLWNLLI